MHAPVPELALGLIVYLTTSSFVLGCRLQLVVCADAQKCDSQKLLAFVSHLTALVLRGCAQGDKVKKGQVLGYIEQLGTFMPVQVPRTHGSPCAALLVALSLSPAPFTPSKLVRSELVLLAQAACKRSRERPCPALALVCRHVWWCVLGRFTAAPPMQSVDKHTLRSDSCAGSPC